MEKYCPPFEITSEMMNLVASIMEKLGRLHFLKNCSKLPKLRRENRIKSIESSCAIESNRLSYEQVMDVLSGHPVIGPEKDILEIKNAFEAYEMAFKKNPYSSSDLLNIHSIMTKNLVSNPGKYRSGGEGVVDSFGNVVFIAPPGKMVPVLMDDLFKWAKDSSKSLNPLILSSVFHFEFVFIHPFSDGNGRMARLWQSVILSSWKPIFEFIPIESIIRKHQAEYYEAIDKSEKKGDSTLFVIFLLKAIDESLTELKKAASKEMKGSAQSLEKLHAVLKKGCWYTSKEIEALLGLSDYANFRKNYLKPLLESGKLIMEYPDKPTSKKQRYLLLK